MKVYAGIDPRMGLRDVVAYSRRVEAIGYDGIHVAETIHDSLAVSLLIAEHTETLTIRTSMALAFVRSPTLTAYSAWDLAKFSRGRFQLGLGTQIRQNIEDRYGMPWGDPIGRMREYVQALTALFHSFESGDPPSYRGSHYRLTRMQPYFNPGPEETVIPPPVFLGGVNAGVCQLAGELAAGFVTHPTNSGARYLETICRPNLLVGATRAGRDLTAFELVVGTHVITGADPTELHQERARQRRLLAFLYSTPAYRATLERYGWGDLAGHLRAMIRADRWQELDSLVSDEVLDTLVPTAAYPDLAAVILERFGHIAQGVLIPPPVNPAHDGRLREVVAALHDDRS